MVKLTAIIMAGGKGSRMVGLGEKPLVKVGGVEMLRRVLNALQDSKHVEGIVVACSPHTPSTAEKARSLGLLVVIAPGEGYVEDMKYVMSKAQIERALVVNSDLPFITGESIDIAVERFTEVRKPALTVMVPTDKMRKLGFEPSYHLAGLSPAGVNLVDATVLHEDETEQETFVMDEILQLININTPADIRRAEKLLVELQAQSTGRGA